MISEGAHEFSLQQPYQIRMTSCRSTNDTRMPYLKNRENSKKRVARELMHEKDRKFELKQYEMKKLKQYSLTENTFMLTVFLKFMHLRWERKINPMMNVRCISQVKNTTSLNAKKVSTAPSTNENEPLRLIQANVCQKSWNMKSAYFHCSDGMSAWLFLVFSNSQLFARRISDNLIKLLAAQRL